MKHGIYVVLAFFKARSCRLLNHFLKDGKRQSTVCPDEVSPVIKKKRFSAQLCGRSIGSDDRAALLCLKAKESAPNDSK